MKKQFKQMPLHQKAELINKMSEAGATCKQVSNFWGCSGTERGRQLKAWAKRYSEKHQRWEELKKLSVKGEFNRFNLTTGLVSSPFIK